MFSNIVLIGMPGSGKSTVGVVLAKKLGFDFLDTDILLAKKEGQTLSEMIGEYGYEEFLRREDTLGKSIECEKTVIATGGSMPLCKDAMKNLKRNSTVVYLRVPIFELKARLPKNLIDRGIAAPSSAGLEDIYDTRRPYYEKNADIVIDCMDGVDNVAAQIEMALF